MPVAEHLTQAKSKLTFLVDRSQTFHLGDEDGGFSLLGQVVRRAIATG